jgi:transcriptional regulator with XRE-family HTH domain
MSRVEALETKSGPRPSVGRGLTARHRVARHAESAVGRELKLLRSQRGVSQMDVALSAGISARHLSFVETGRAHPGRDVLLGIGKALSLTWGELKVLLAFAGYEPPQPPRRRPSTMELSPVLESVCSVLAEVEPLPAVLADAAWDLLIPNAAYVRLCECLVPEGLFPRGPFQVADLPRPNLLLTLLNPNVRKSLRNWDQVAGALLWRVQREQQATGDASLGEVLAAARDLLGAGAAPLERTSKRGGAFPIRVDLVLNGQAVRCFSLVTCWATSLPGLHIELLHPIDERSMRRLAVALGVRKGDVAL